MKVSEQAAARPDPARHVRDGLFRVRLPTYYPGIFSNANVPPGGANKLEAHDLLRLNLASTPGASFPNGRRLGDDVLDVLVQVAAGVFLDNDGIINKLNGTPNDPGQGVPFSALRDGVAFDSGQPVLGTFPYAPAPISPFKPSYTAP